MTTSELKEILYQEHKRDLRLTFIGHFLVFLIALVVLALTYLYALDLAMNYFQGIADFMNGKNALITKILTALVPFIMIGYFVVQWMRILKRPKQIEAFVTKIEEGKIAENISEYTIYKIIIPLVKIKLNLCPVNMAQVQFSRELKMFKLPIPSWAMPDLKTLLSGVDAADANKLWHELYDGETTENEAITPLKPLSTFDTFVKTELSNDLQEIDKKRGKFKFNYLYAIAMAVVFVGGFLYFQLGMASGKFNLDTTTIMIGFGIVSVLMMGISMLMQRKKPQQMDEGHDLQFKTKVFKRMVEFINPNFKYIMHGHIGLAEFLEMGFFENKHYDLGGNDQIIGKHSGVPFQLCDLSASRTRNFSNEKDAPDEVFFGQVFIAKFNKEFKNDVYLIPKRLERFFNTDDTSLHLEYLGEKVQLEDPEFMKLFNVYAQDQVEARYILSTNLMERIKGLIKSKKDNYLISFRNNRISMANHSKKNNFEVSMFKSITKNNQVQEFYEELCNQLKIIDDLKLNINIWKG